MFSEKTGLGGTIPSSSVNRIPLISQSHFMLYILSQYCCYIIKLPLNLVNLTKSYVLIK